jgi:hypothetical protein
VLNRCIAGITSPEFGYLARAGSGPGKCDDVSYVSVSCVRWPHLGSNTRGTYRHYAPFALLM